MNLSRIALRGFDDPLRRERIPQAPLSRIHREELSAQSCRLHPSPPAYDFTKLLRSLLNERCPVVALLYLLKINSMIRSAILLHPSFVLRLLLTDGFASFTSAT